MNWAKLLLVVVVVVAFHNIDSFAIEPLYDMLAPRVFKAMDHVDKSFSLLKRWTKVTDFMIAFSVASLAMAIVKPQLSRDEFRILLMSGAAVLASGVFFTHSWASWPLAYMAPGHSLWEKYNAAVTWVTLNVAVVYSAMLAVVFVPPMLKRKSCNSRGVYEILALLSPIIVPLAVELLKWAAESS